MRFVAAVVLVVACGPGIPYRDQRDVASNVLVAASGDAAAIESLLRGSVVVGGLWFADTTCAPFSGGGKLAPERFHELARCLATLHWAQSARRDALADTTVLTYAPGFEIEARVVQELAGPRLTWIGYVARRDTSDALPTITPHILEALRTAGDRNGPVDPDRAKDIELDASAGEHSAFAWFRVCIDGTGVVTSTQLRETTSLHASDAFAAAIAKWQFRPFTVANTTIPACSMMRLVYPPGPTAKDETIPLPAPPSRNKKQPIVFAAGARLFEARRVSGEKLILPDDSVKRAMQKQGVSKVIGAFRLCLDDTGSVESVLPIKSTGFADYDRELGAAIWKWTYTPFLVEGVAQPVCTAITFIYSQS
jgi:hypothetical protein